MVKSRGFSMTPPQPSPSPPPARVSARRHLTAVVALLLIAFAPLAWAQTASDTDNSGSSSSGSSSAPPKKHKKKKAAKPAASASASDAATAEPPPPAEPTPTVAAEAAPPPSAAPSASAAVPNTPPEEPWDVTNTREDPNKRYLFLGLRYRGTIIPQFFENIFVDQGKTIYSNSIGLELDIRSHGLSTIPWIEYDDYTTGNILFHQKGNDPTDAAFYSVVKSSLKAIYVGLDERWSINLVPDKLDYELGFGVGIGGVFGDLHNGWVYQTANGSLSANVNGQTLNFAPCPSQNGQRGCNVTDHQNATVAKVNGYVEPNWFNGGSVPTIFPSISLVPVSLRYKPLKMLEMRVSLGIQLTGFFFNIGADYGFEQKPEKTDTPVEEHKASRETSLRDTL
jgi:hypothetical protein